MEAPVLEDGRFSPPLSTSTEQLLGQVCLSLPFTGLRSPSCFCSPPIRKGWDALASDPGISAELETRSAHCKCGGWVTSPEKGSVSRPLTLLRV